MSDKIMQLDLNSFTAEIEKSEKPALVDFWAPWCGPCRAIGPVVEQLAKEFDGKLTVGKVNVDDNQDLAIKFGVQSIPTLLIFKGGQVVQTIIGNSPGDLRKAVEAVV